MRGFAAALSAFAEHLPTQLPRVLARLTAATLVVALAVVPALRPQAARANCDAVAEKVADNLVRTMLEKMGGKVMGGGLQASDVAVKYMEHPDDDGLKAALKKLVKTGAGIAFPEFKLVYKGGEMLVSSRDYAEMPAHAVADLLEQSDDHEVNVMRNDFFSENYLVQKGTDTGELHHAHEQLRPTRIAA